MKEKKKRAKPITDAIASCSTTLRVRSRRVVFFLRVLSLGTMDPTKYRCPSRMTSSTWLFRFKPRKFFLRFANLQMNRHNAAVCVLGHNNASSTSNHFGGSRLEIAAQIRVMRRRIRLRHDGRDVAAQNLLGVAKQLLQTMIHELNHSHAVDHHHGCIGFQTTKR
jgi:hypothetical protein